VLLVTDDPTAAEQFQKIPAIDDVSRQGNRYILKGHGDLVTQVIECVSESRIRVTEFRTSLPTLEDVFLKLTGHSIRD
jgi:ABC-2 type transport system ATP-binding protein